MNLTATIVNGPTFSNFLIITLLSACDNALKTHIIVAPISAFYLRSMGSEIRYIIDLFGKFKVYLEYYFGRTFPYNLSLHNLFMYCIQYKTSFQTYFFHKNARIEQAQLALQIK